jgi:hypothetical protein
MNRLWIVAAAAFMVMAFAGSPASADTLVGDIDTADPLSDINPTVWSGSDQNPSLPNQLADSSPATEEAWGEAILGLTTDLVFIDRDELSGTETSLSGYDPGFTFQYAIVKYAGFWALYSDSENDNLLDVGPFDFGISHVTFFNPDGVTVPEPSIALLLGTGLVGVGAFARARRRRE